MTVPAEGPDDARERLIQFACAGVLAATVLFNPFLAIVNAHALHIGGAPVAGIQALLVLAAFVLGATGRPLPLRWLMLGWGLALAFFATCLLRGDFQPKNLGDMLIIPAFICLGTRIDERLLIRTTAALIGAVAVVGFWELQFPKAYGKFFKVLDYYVATRGYDKSQFYAGGDLFVSATRGGGRYLLQFTHWHRGSSLFLEPVTLGNWAVVVAIVLATFWTRLSVRMRVYFVACILATLVICDGRLALGVCLLLLPLLPLARYLPERAAAIYIPVVIAILWGFKAAGYLPQSGDTLTGRFRGGFDLLFDLDTLQLFGLGDMSKAAVDAGWVYLIETQGIIVSLGVWLLIMFTDTGDTRAARMMKHGMGIFIVLCLPISYSILSVKTSALMWAVYGYFYQHTARANALRCAAPAPRAEEISPSLRLVVPR